MTGVRTVGTEKIIDKILADANSKADLIIKEAEDEAKTLMAQTGKSADSKKEESLEKGRVEAELTKKRIIASAQMEAKKLLLKTKQDLLAEAFEAALAKIRGMSDEDFRALMTRLIAGMIETGKETVIINDADKKRLGADFLKSVNESISKDRPCSITLSDEVRDIPSGFILKRGDIEINATFEALFRQNRDALSAEIVKILF